MKREPTQINGPTLIHKIEEFMYNNKMKRLKRLLAIAMILALSLGVLPIAEAVNSTPNETYSHIDYVSPTLWHDKMDTPDPSKRHWYRRL